MACRIMSNVDKDLDYMISPQEFYQLLSQKFEKDDPKEEIMAASRAGIGALFVLAFLSFCCV